MRPARSSNLRTLAVNATCLRLLVVMGSEEMMGSQPRRSTPSPGAPELLSCRQRVIRASKVSGQEETRRHLPQTPRECLTARLLLHCANRELTDFAEQALNTPRLDGSAPTGARRREVEAVFFWQMRLCEPFRSLPDLELLFSKIIAALEKQFKSLEGVN